MELNEIVAEQSAIREWLVRYGAMRAERDERIRRAVTLGIPRVEIARLTGLSRQHVSYMLRTKG
jgi:predicted transcriptional regulator